MEMRTERVLGYGRAKMAASCILGDVEHNLNVKANSYWEHLRHLSIKNEQFDAYNKMNSSERRDEIIRVDRETARAAIIADAIVLYLAKLEEGRAGHESN